MRPGKLTTLRRLKGGGVEARTCVIALPGAGGVASSFRPWVACLPDDAELWAVQRPGRQDRLREPAQTRVSEMVDDLACGLETLTDREVIVFGHSMGGIVAFELLRALRARAAAARCRLVVAAARAPHVRSSSGLASLTREEDLTSALNRLGGTSSTLLADPAIRAVVLPAVRADLRAEATYTLAPDAPLECDVAVAYAEADPLVTPSEALGWREHTTGDFISRVFCGGHFFHQERPRDMVNFILSPRSGETGPGRDRQLRSAS